MRDESGKEIKGALWIRQDDVATALEAHDREVEAKARLAEHKMDCSRRLGTCSRCIELGDEPSIRAANFQVAQLRAQAGKETA